MPHNRPPEPWHSFFLDIDKVFDEPIALHCIGGFAIAMLHGLPRPTVDVDCLAVIPVGETARLQTLAEEGSALHKKYGVYVQHVGVMTAPENYTDRLRLMFPTVYRRLLLMGLEAHDWRCRSWNGIQLVTGRTSGFSRAQSRSISQSWKAVTIRNFGPILGTLSGTI